MNQEGKVGRKAYFEEGARYRDLNILKETGKAGVILIGNQFHCVRV